MSIDNISDNRAVTGSDGGRSAANLNYILYIIGFFTGITALVGVILAYSHRDTASETFRSHFDWQIKIFWRSVRFFIVMSILYFVFTLIAVVTLGLGFILYLIPFGIWIWWLVSTIKRVAAGMKALGLGQPIGFYSGSPPSGTAAAAPAAIAAAPPPAPVVSMPPEGWYADSARAGHTRWWDGTAWGIRDDEHPSVASGAPIADAGGANGAPVPSGSLPLESGSVRPDDAEIAVPPAGSPPETHQEPAVTPTATAPSSEAPPAAASSSAPEPASAPPPVRFCENCGAERRPGGRFCTNCGHA